MGWRGWRGVGSGLEEVERGWKWVGGGEGSSRWVGGERGWRWVGGERGWRWVGRGGEGLEVSWRR